MTRSPKSEKSDRVAQEPERWHLRDAKAQFNEIVRRAQCIGPQYVSVGGEDGVVIVSEKEYRRLSGNPTGRALVEAFLASPHRAVGIAPKRVRLPVRKLL